MTCSMQQWKVWKVEWGGSSSGKLQHHGVLRQETKATLHLAQLCECGKRQLQSGECPKCPHAKDLHHIPSATARQLSPT